MWENEVLRPRILVGVKVILVVSVARRASNKMSCMPGCGVRVWALA
jgi:hypothetical protein